MEEIFAVLLVLFVLLAVVTVIGHGIWVGLAAVFRAIRPRKEQPPVCRFCYHRMPSNSEHCPACGRSQVSPMAAELADLEAFGRQVDRFEEAGTLDPPLAEQLRDRAAEHRRTLFGGSLGTDAAVPKTAPVVAEAVEEPSSHRSPGETLAAFMQQRNIRWGELIGGLLIVGSSIALVLSLWTKLRDIPHFPFLGFSLVTAAVFGAGFYAHRRWKLDSTSRGLLIIGALLVPLDFLAMAALSEAHWTPLSGLLGAAVLGLFGVLLDRAGRILVPGGRGWLVLGVLGSTAVVFGLGYLGDQQGDARWLIPIGCLPGACFAAAVVGLLQTGRYGKSLDEARLASMLTVGGTSLAAMLVALGLLVSRASWMDEPIDLVILPLAMAALPLLVTGLRVGRGARRKRALAPWVAAGTAIGLFGVGAMLGALGQAWPHPEAMLAVGAIGAATLMAAGFGPRHPILYPLAIAVGLAAGWTGPWEGESNVFWRSVFLAELIVLVPGAAALPWDRRWPGERLGAAWRRDVVPLPYILLGPGLGAVALLAGYAWWAEPLGNQFRTVQYAVLGSSYAATTLLVLVCHLLGRRERVASLGVPGWLVQSWFMLFGALAVGVTMFHADGNPQAARLRIGTLLALSVAAGIAALWRRVSVHVYASGLLLSAAATVGWMAWGDDSLRWLIYANVTALSAGSILWTLVGLLPRGVPHPHLGRPVPYAELAAMGATALMGLVVAGLMSEALLLLEFPAPEIARADWLMLGTAVGAVAMLLWNRNTRFAMPGLYLLGLAALGFELLARELPSPRAIVWTAAAEVAGFALVAALAGWLLPKAGNLWRAMRITGNPTSWPRPWFHVCQTGLIGLSALLAAWISISFRFDSIGQDTAVLGLAGRWCGVATALIVLGATIVMAWQSRATATLGEKIGTGTSQLPESAAWAWSKLGASPVFSPARQAWQAAALWAGLLLNAALGFAGLDATPDTVTAETPWLHRSVTLLIAAGMLTLLSRFGLGRVLPSRSDWIAAGRRMAPAFAVTALVVLAATLGQETALFDRVDGVPMLRSAMATVALALVGLAVGCLAVALRPAWDPWHLDDRGRQAYVYAAEVLLAAFGLHLWLTMPWLFAFGIIERYWMLLVMAIAFAGAGLSEWFRRLRMPVLSEPLQNTALLAPLVPAVGYWILPESDTMLTLAGRTPLLWVLMSVFYGLVAAREKAETLPPNETAHLPQGLSRHSRAGGNLENDTNHLDSRLRGNDVHRMADLPRKAVFPSILSGLAAAIAFWTSLDHLGVAFLEQPQLWVVPVALVLLVAEYLNHDRLTDGQSTAMRYLAMGAIYITATTEMLIDGIADHWWLPTLLMAWSVGGALLGILLRVRSFLFLGVTFLVVDLAAMIHYAAVGLGQWWIAAASGIALGAAVLVLFALFEKRRNEILATIERLKQWER